MSVTLELLLTTASFGSQNSARTWHQPSIFSFEQFLEQQFLVTCIGEVAWEEQLGRVGLEGALPS